MKIIQWDKKGKVKNKKTKQYKTKKKREKEWWLKEGVISTFYAIVFSGIESLNHFCL